MSSLPQPTPKQPYLRISPLSGGFITLPDSAFVSPADPSSKRYVPSLSFLITHPGLTTASQQSSFLGTLLDPKAHGSPITLLFDLGLRGSATRYLPAQQKHLENRRPYKLEPRIAAQLREGGVDPARVDAVILSHVHYDHHGDPTEYPNATFLVGHSALGVVKNGLPKELGASHQHFDSSLFDGVRAIEFPPTSSSEWKPLGPFPHALDLFGDGSAYVLDMPGHLPGHLNLLARIGEGKWVCLCGDAYHDPRLLTGEKEIGMWEGDGGRMMCIHLDKAKAEESIERLRELKEGGNVEKISAHDDGWMGVNKERFFPYTL